MFSGLLINFGLEMLRRNGEPAGQPPEPTTTLLFGRDAETALTRKLLVRGIPFQLRRSFPRPWENPKATSRKPPAFPLEEASHGRHIPHFSIFDEQYAIESAAQPTEICLEKFKKLFRPIFRPMEPPIPGSSLRCRFRCRNSSDSCTTDVSRPTSPGLRGSSAALLSQIIEHGYFSYLPAQAPSEPWPDQADVNAGSLVCLSVCLFACLSACQEL